MSLVEDNRLGSETYISLAMPGDFIELMKPRVMSLVVFTAFVGMVLAPGPIDPILGAIAIMCIAVGAGASGALNMWYDRDIDAVMQRTARRPIPSGRVSAHEALSFGLVLTFMSVMTLGLLANWLAASLLAFTIFFYVVIYTAWLKRWTPQNIVIGGVAGALPPVIGWAAAANTISLESVMLFAIIFLWTPPHFWALALFRSDDYDRAKVPMMPNTHGEATTKTQILAYSLVLAVVGVMPWWFGFAGNIYGVTAVAGGIGFIWLAAHLYGDRDNANNFRSAKRLFGYSIIYLFALYAVLLAQTVLASWVA